MKKNLLDFDFDPKQIAYFPKEKGKSKMLVVPKQGNTTIEKPLESFTRSLIDYLSVGDCFVLNNTKVIPARLMGYNNKQFSVEILLLEEQKQGIWEVMGKPGNRLKKDQKVFFSEEVSCTVLDVLSTGHRIVQFESKKEDFYIWLDKHGQMPLPPYINREEHDNDKLDYQSVFAKIKGSVAAPTASLHLSQAMLNQIKEKGVRIVEITLHIGVGTFKPLDEEIVENHQIHTEWFSVSEQVAEILNDTVATQGKIFAVGTTVARTLETICQKNRVFKAQSGKTDVFIYPGYVWKAVDALFTNFHWPASTLLFLVASLLGVEKTKEYYKLAVKNNYRLFSYGDAMLIF